MIRFKVRDNPVRMTVADAVVVLSGGENYEGSYEVTPKADEQQTLHTKGLLMKDDVQVLAVPYYEMDNQTGTTIYIASEV